MQRVLPVFVLFFAVGLPIGAFAREKPLPVELMQAKTVYVQMAEFVPTNKDADHGEKASYTAPCLEALSKWARLKVVSDPKEADIILRISSLVQRGSQQIATGQVVGSVASSNALTTVDVLQASTGTRLWTESGLWVWAFTAKLITRNLVNGLRKEVEAQEKLNGQNSGAAGEVAGSQAESSGQSASQGAGQAASQSTGQAEEASDSTATTISSVSASTNGDRATSDQQSPSYGPLTFDSEGADFYVAQNGRFAPASVSDGTIEIHLRPGSFQIGYNGEQMNMCLAQAPSPEMKTSPHGEKASCLSGAMTGARERNSDGLLVYSGKKWSDGNTDLSDATSMKAAPMKGYKFAYQVNKLEFVVGDDMPVSGFKGTLYGYIVVYKQQVRSNKDIMPIHLIFE